MSVPRVGARNKWCKEEKEGLQYLCGENDHNKRTCPNKEKIASLNSVGDAAEGKAAAVEV